MMPSGSASLQPHAAALQCVAEDFRRFAAEQSRTDQELKRFASVLDHIAAALIVTGPEATPSPQWPRLSAL